MKRKTWHIILLCAALPVLFFSCGKDGARVIPRSVLAKIYAEMLVTDQWIAYEPSVKHVADTSLVYEPILEKYGYTSEDYRKSVEHYLDDPDRFSRIFRSASEILDARIRELKELLEIRDKMMIKHDFGISVGHVVPDIGNIPPSYTPDSLAFDLDTALMYFRMRYVERYDTVYRGPEIIVRTDSVSVCDSICKDGSMPARSIPEENPAEVKQQRNGSAGKTAPLRSGVESAVFKMSPDTLAGRIVPDK